MKKYSQVALLAVQLIENNKYMSPGDAWKRAALKVFGEGSSGALKGCPRSAFLGLCEEGLVRDVFPGKYTRSVKNKKYAIRAAVLLRGNPALAASTTGLWMKVAGRELSHNGQMDVVIALWEKGLVL